MNDAEPFDSSEPALYVMLNLNNNAVGIAGSLEELSAMPTARTSAKSR